jgi:ribosomal protein S12 methylthiotransferase accessory factor
MHTVVGSGPGAEAAAAGLADAGVETTREVEHVEQADVALVVGRAGSNLFERANEAALAGETAWLAVELGGLGGYPVVDAAVTGLAPGRGCYDCLRSRVDANHGGDRGVDSSPDPATARLAGAVAGHEAVRHASDGADIFGRVVVVPYTERPLLPVPTCDCGSKPGWSVPRGHTERGLEEALALAERSLDDRVGLVQEVGEAESFPVPYYLAQLCDTSVFSDDGRSCVESLQQRGARGRQRLCCRHTQDERW